MLLKSQGCQNCNLQILFMVFIHGPFSCGGPQQSLLLATAAAATKSLPELPEVRTCTMISLRDNTAHLALGVVRAHSTRQRGDASC